MTLVYQDKTIILEEKFENYHSDNFKKLDGNYNPKTKIWKFPLDKEKALLNYIRNNMIEEESSDDEDNECVSSTREEIVLTDRQIIFVFIVIALFSRIILNVHYDYS